MASILDDWLTERGLVDIHKHLPGGHDQASHGRRGGQPGKSERRSASLAEAKASYQRAAGKITPERKAKGEARIAAMAARAEARKGKRKAPTAAAPPVKVAATKPTKPAVVDIPTTTEPAKKPSRHDLPDVENTHLPLDGTPRIKSVKDTRKWEEVEDDVFEPVPGSGVENPCARCGRTHDVIYHVEYPNGRTALVGAGCARGDGAITGPLKSISSAAKTLTRAKAKYEKGVRHTAAIEDANAMAQRLKVPEKTVEAGDGRDVWRIGSDKVWVWHDQTKGPDSRRYLAERERSLGEAWRSSQARAILQAQGLSDDRPNLDELRRMQTRAEKRLAAAIAAQEPN